MNIAHLLKVISRLVWSEKAEVLKNREDTCCWNKHETGSKGRKEIHTGGWGWLSTGAENSLASTSRKGGVGRGAINSVDIAVLVDQDAWVLTLDAGDCAEANLS